jgi:hypothetical protein
MINFFKKEGQECKQTFEFIRKLDPYNLDFMDIYSNILFVLVFISNLKSW